MIYVDTSVLVSATVREADSAAAQNWLAAQSPGLLVISRWVVTEFSSALSAKVRSRTVTPQFRAIALSEFTKLVAESLDLVSVGDDDFTAASRLADQYETGLRAGDALHLAVAVRIGAALCTRDRLFAKAALLHGVKSHLID